MNELMAKIGEEITIHDSGKEFICKVTAIKEDKPEPKFKPGDKVVSVSKTVPGYERNIEVEQHWAASKERGYFFANRICEALTQKHGQNVYYCASQLPWSYGNYYFESDLIPYVEPKPEPKEAPVFTVGDRVKIKKGLKSGAVYDDGCYFTCGMARYCGEETRIKGVSTTCKNRFNLTIDNGRWYYSPSMLELAPIINHCPEPKTITESGATFIFRDNVTVCIIDADGRKFKGIARCAPEDTWDEDTGKDWAYIRAMRKLLNAIEKNLKETN